jgi:uncharacterized protein YbjT (DUF2867 family)
METLTTDGILVIGGTGTVGRDVVTGLLQQNRTVRVLTRSQEHADAIPHGALPVLGDMEDPTTYDTVFADTQKLFLLNPVSMTELHQGLAAVNEARRRGIEHLVYLSVHNPYTMPHAPHIASKIAIENAIKESGLTYTILRPNNFYQNDYWFEDAIRQHGIYPQPIGDVGLSRVDTRDVADAAVNALTQDGHADQTYTLVGPDVLTGPDCAALYAKALNQDVAYGGNDLDAWETQSRAMLPDWMAYDFRLMYETFQKRGLKATNAQHHETRTILGHEPRSFRAFVDEIAQQWRRPPVTA